MSNTDNTKKVSLFKKLSYIFDKKQKGQLLILAVLIVIGGLLETGGVGMLLPVMGVITKPESVYEKIAKFDFLQRIVDTLNLGYENRGNMIKILIITLIVFFVVKNLYLLFLIYKQNTFITRARNDMISRVMREFLNRPYEDYLGADIPTVFRITDSDIPKTFTLMLSILSLATEVVVTVCLSIVVLAINWQMTVLMTIVFLIVTLIITKVLKPRLNKIGRENQETQSRIAKWRIQAIYGLKDVKVLNRQDFFIRNYYESGKVGADIARNYTVMNNIPRLLIETMFIVVVFLYILIYILGGGMPETLMAQLTAIAAAALRLMPSVNRINTYLTEIAYNQFSLDFVYNNLTESMKIDKEMRAERAAIAGPELHLEKEIRIKDITFAYPDADTNIFTGANMVVPKGKSVGIMGPSGAGKSTVVDIILGLCMFRRVRSSATVALSSVTTIPGLLRSDTFPSQFIWWMSLFVRTSPLVSMLTE